MGEPMASEAELATGAAPTGAAPTGARTLPWMRIVIGVVAAVVALYLPFAYNPGPNKLFAEVLYIAIAAMGLNLLTGFNGQVSIGHGAFYGVGAFTSAILVVDHGWPIEATIPVAAVTAAILGVVIGFPALRVKGLYLALITLGLAVLFPAVASKFVTGEGGISLLQPDASDVSSYFPDLLENDQYRYFLCLAVTVVLFLLAWNLMRTRVGRAMIAVRDQEVAATTVGINVARVKVATFALSAAYAGVAGALGFMVEAVADATNPLIYFQQSISFLIAVVIGGAATITGPLLGAAFLVWVRERSKGIEPFGPIQNTAELAPAVLGGTLIIAVYILPDGIVGGLRRLSAYLQRRFSSSASPTDPPPTDPDSNQPPTSPDPVADPTPA